MSIYILLLIVSVVGIAQPQYGWWALFLVSLLGVLKVF